MQTNGYIYLIQDQRTFLTKIGFSSNPLRRLRQLTHEATLLPQPLSFRLKDAFQGTLQEEQRLHSLFKKQRVRGEWFNLCFWRYMDIITAFDERPRATGMFYEPCGRVSSDPFDLITNDICRCEECND